MLESKNILLGVSGGIAACKAALLVRRLREAGSAVRVVMTQGAQSFVTPLSFQAMSGNRVHTDLLDAEAEAAMGHIELARWADLILIAPASAHCLAKLAGGLADDLLATLCLASTAPLWVAPAMNHMMWQHAATRRNCRILQERGVQFIGPDSGDQACGELGPGRMTEPEEIVRVLAAAGTSRQQASPLLRALAGKHLVITAGPTREAMDPVRFISNHSSGKQGYALAEAAAAMGLRVTLISGPVKLPVPAGVTCIQVTSAEEMLQAALAEARQSDIFLGVAAVADYRPQTEAKNKIKRDAAGETLTVQLVRNPDIVAEVAALAPAPFTVGFAAETDKLLEHARAKMQRKGLQLIVANDVSDPSIGFNSDENEVIAIWPAGERRISRCSKKQLAGELLELIAERMQQAAGAANHA